jgi:hypothetical protein
MSHLIQIDDRLYEVILEEKHKLEASGCKNPSYSNSIRTLFDMPHISGKGKDRHDVCGQNTKVTTKVDLIQTEKPEEKELGGEEEI